MRISLHVEPGDCDQFSKARQKTLRARALLLSARGGVFLRICYTAAFTATEHYKTTSYSTLDYFYRTSLIRCLCCRLPDLSSLPPWLFVMVGFGRHEIYDLDLSQTAMHADPRESACSEKLITSSYPRRINRHVLFIT